MSYSHDIKKDFEIFEHHPNLVYLDSASSALVPRKTVDAVSRFLNETVVSSRRGAHRLAVEGGRIVENVRKSLSKAFGTPASQISFQKSLDQAIASLVYGFDWSTEQKQKIAVAQSEEHSVFVSILRAAEVLGLDIEIMKTTPNGQILESSIEEAIDEETGIVAASHTTLGTGNRNPLRRISETAHEKGAILLCDASRAFPFESLTIEKLGADIVLFSANTTLLSPPGLTIQWLTKSLNEEITPGILGGNSVTDVSLESFDSALPPDRYESGILNVPAIVGLGSSIEYIQQLKKNGFDQHIQSLVSHMNQRLADLDCISFYGGFENTSMVFGMNIGDESGMNCHDVAMFLDQSNIAVRSGLLCAHPLIRPLSDSGIVQVSLHYYNTISDVDRFVDAIELICEQLL